MNGLASRGEPAAVSVYTWKRGCTSHLVRTTSSTVPHCTENMAVGYIFLDLALQRGTGTVKPLIATETEFEEPACRMPDEKNNPREMKCSPSWSEEASYLRDQFFEAD